MSDERITSLLSAYLDDEVSVAERREVEQLLESNSSVREEYEALLATRNLFSSLKKLDPPAYLSTNIASGIRNERRNSFRSRTRKILKPKRLHVPVLTYAASLFVVIGALLMYRAYMVSNEESVVESELFVMDYSVAADEGIEAEETLYTIAEVETSKNTESEEGNNLRFAELKEVETEEDFLAEEASEPMTLAEAEPLAPSARMAKTRGVAAPGGDGSEMDIEAVFTGWDVLAVASADDSTYFPAEPSYFRVEILETIISEIINGKTTTVEEEYAAIPAFEFLVQDVSQPLDALTVFAELEIAPNGKVLEIEVEANERYAGLLASFKRHMLNRRLPPLDLGGHGDQLRVFVAANIYRVGALAD